MSTTASQEMPAGQEEMVLGRYYLRPCVRTSWPLMHNKARWIPVLGRPTRTGSS